MGMRSENEVFDLLTALRPWFAADHAYLFDLAKTDWAARLSIAVMLAESGHADEAEILLASIVEGPPREGDAAETARIHAAIEWAHLRMERLQYAEAEELLWDARKRFRAEIVRDLRKEEISLMIAECRLGQGFVQDAIDRATEVERKLLAEGPQADFALLAKTYQQLGWYYWNKVDVPSALTYLKKALELAPHVDRGRVDAGLQAERSGRFQEAIEHYFDAISYDSEASSHEAEK